jgi:hypothetical protein
MIRTFDVSLVHPLPSRLARTRSLVPVGMLAAVALSCGGATNANQGAQSGSSGNGSSSGASGSGAETGASMGGSGSSASGSAGGAGSGTLTSNSGAQSGAASGTVEVEAGGGGPEGGTTVGMEGGTAGGDGGAAGGCAGKTYKLCEDFESGAVGAIPTGWTLLKGFGGGGTIGLANDQAHSGTMSLKSSASTTGQNRVQKSLMALGPTATNHWGRIFYRVGTPEPKPNNGVIHITLTALEGSTENRVVDTVVNTAGNHQWLFNIPDDSCCTSSAYNWTFEDSWHCAEWNVDVATESFQFYTDGVNVPALSFTGRAGAHMSNYTSVGLGTIFYQVPPNPVVVWFDDLAIDDTQIGCQ